MFDGFVSVDGTDLHPIRISMDTDFSQSLFYIGRAAIVWEVINWFGCVNSGWRVEISESSSSYEIGSWSDLVFWNIGVGVIPTLPVKGSFLLLENYLEG